MRPVTDIVALSAEVHMLDVIQGMTQHGVGAACIVEGEKLIGIVSESDVRRHLIQDRNFLDRPAGSIMNHDPAVVEPELLAFEALEIFQNFAVKIGELPVVSGGVLLGLLVLKDLVRSGIV